VRKRLGASEMDELGGRTARLAGTAMLSALIVVLDYGLKFSGLKIPFPWLPFLKFDFTGVPVILSLLLYGLPSAATTSIVACIAITLRSGKLVSAALKALAELSTASGMALGLRLPGRWRRVSSAISGVALRLVVMSVANLVVLPAYYQMPYGVVVGLLPLMGVFNIVQGSLTVLLGLMLHEAIARRLRSNPR